MWTVDYLNSLQILISFAKWVGYALVPNRVKTILKKNELDLHSRYYVTTSVSRLGNFLSSWQKILAEVDQTNPDYFGFFGKITFHESKNLFGYFLGKLSYP